MMLVLVDAMSELTAAVGSTARMYGFEETGSGETMAVGSHVPDASVVALQPHAQVAQGASVLLKKAGEKKELCSVTRR